MTPGTLQPNPQEHLRGVGGDRMQLIVSRLPIPVDGGSVLPFTGGGDNSSDEFVVRAVAGDHVLDPVVKRVRRLVGSGELRVPQDRSPAHREVRGIVG